MMKRSNKIKRILIVENLAIFTFHLFCFSKDYCFHRYDTTDCAGTS